METIISYAKEAAEAFKYYVSNNGVDERAESVYQYIQNINNLTDEEREDLELFISENSFDIKHLADITYINDAGQAGTLDSLSRMKPFVVSKPTQRFYEARGNGLQIVKNNNQKTVKVYKRTSLKKAA